MSASCLVAVVPAMSDEGTQHRPVEDVSTIHQTDQVKSSYIQVRSSFMATVILLYDAFTIELCIHYASTLLGVALSKLKQILYSKT